MEKVVIDLKDPVYYHPTRLVKIYYNNKDGTMTKARATNGKKSVKAMNELDYTIETETTPVRFSIWDSLQGVEGQQSKRIRTCDPSLSGGAADGAQELGGLGKEF